MGHGHAIISAVCRFLRGIRRNTRGGFILLTLISAAFAGLFAAGAQADELSLLINGKAIHINTPNGQHLNESNWGMGFQYDWAPMDQGGLVPFAMASGFSDSNKNPSYYVGGGVLRRFESYNGLRFDIGVIGFAMTRKNYKNDKPFLGALPAFSVGTKRFAVNMTYIPKVDPKMVALFFFQLKINIDALR
jgi:Antimicrobial peptide resistance and lipid A acylation protein PagP